MEVSRMTKAETIAYAIKKECCRYSLIEWCEDWGITVDDFEKFLKCGEKGFAEQGGEQDD
jgi:hypothetical protein